MLPELISSCYMSVLYYKLLDKTQQPLLSKTPTVTSLVKNSLSLPRVTPPGLFGPNIIPHMYNHLTLNNGDDDRNDKDGVLTRRQTDS